MRIFPMIWAVADNASEKGIDSYAATTRRAGHIKLSIVLNINYPKLENFNRQLIMNTIIM